MPFSNFQQLQSPELKHQNCLVEANIALVTPVSHILIVLSQGEGKASQRFGTYVQEYNSISEGHAF